MIRPGLQLGQSLVVEVPSAARPRGENDSTTTSAQRTRSSSTSRPSCWRRSTLDAALAGRHVEQQAGGVVARRVLDERADGAGHVEVAAGLDPDDGGPEVGHDPRRGRSGHRPREVEHLDARRAVRAGAALARRHARRARRAGSPRTSSVCSPRRGARPRRTAVDGRRAAPRAGRGDRRRSRARRRRRGPSSRGPRTADCAGRRRAWPRARSAGSVSHAASSSSALVLVTQNSPTMPLSRSYSSIGSRPS